MKKLLIFTLPLLALCFFLPQTSHAMKVKKYKHAYSGTWENTYNDCDYTSNTGYLEIKIKKIKKSGKIKEAHVWFSNTGTYMEAKGEVYKYNGVKYISLEYQENGWDYDSYLITGTITANYIDGYYDHYTLYPYSSYYGCYWGGTAVASK